MAAPQVGPVVRAMRKSRGLTLAGLAAQSGLSVPFLSQIENGRAGASLRSLQSLAAALGTTAVALLGAAEDAAHRDVVRAGENAMADDMVGAVRLLVHGSRQLHALEFDGATEHGGRSFTHANDELLYVVHGSVQARADQEEYQLQAGDTLYWPSGVEHSWRALTPDTKLIIVAVNEHARVTLHPAPEGRPVPRTPRA